jgi:hypothetical protein
VGIEAVVALVAGTVIVLVIPALFWSPTLSKWRRREEGQGKKK